ncbi:MAG: peptidoglycan-binding domain-containing protein [Pyrinomonadaceae bacterium]
MKKITLMLFVMLSLSFAVLAQQTGGAPTQTATTAQTKPPIFRANKDQIMQVQKMLKATETGKLDDETRAAIKTYQAANGLKSTGTLNRATLEKMNVALTDKQKEIPVSPNSFASSETSKTAKSSAPRKAVFRANKEQISTAQKMLKEKGMLGGEQTGKLDAATRDGIRKFQESVKMKVTGTLNKETLEKMNIALTDKQKEM